MRWKGEKGREGRDMLNIGRIIPCELTVVMQQKPIAYFQIFCDSQKTFYVCEFTSVLFYCLGTFVVVVLKVILKSEMEFFLYKV